MTITYVITAAGWWIYGLSCIALFMLYTLSYFASKRGWDKIWLGSMVGIIVIAIGLTWYKFSTMLIN